MQWPWKTSLALIFLGVLVVFFSLQSMQSKAVAQEMALEEEPAHKECDPESWFDSNLPGSVVYTLERAAERLAMVSQRGEARTSSQLAHAQSRLEASHYAWEKQQTHIALQTVHKSFLYLSQAAPSDSHAAEKTAIADELAATLEQWNTTELTTSQRALLEQTLAQLQAVRQHHHF